MISEPTRSDLKLRMNRLFCPFDRGVKELFFSLVDYRNNLFTSNDIDKIIEFYNGFENRDQLIQWMKERPKGVANIHEVEGDKDIIVVIPTADFNGKYAKECRDNIFRGLHVVFVESGGKGDFYFNYAHNCNVGIRKAMEYNPKWIVVSNDDMQKIDNSYKLKNELFKLDSSKIDAVFTYPSQSNYHSYNAQIVQFNVLGIIVSRIVNVFHNNEASGILMKIRQKFKIDFIFHREMFYEKFLSNKIFKFIHTGNLAIVSEKFAVMNNGVVYDETFINASEDVDLSLRLQSNSMKIVRIDYNIGDLIGGTFGTNVNRFLREQIGNTYLSYKIDKKILDVS